MDRPVAIEVQGIHGQAAERGQDPHAVALPVAMRVLPELSVAGPVPGVLGRPAVAEVPQQLRGRSTQTRDVLSGFVDGLALMGALTARRQDRGAARAVLLAPSGSGHAPPHLGEVTAAFAFTLAGLTWRLAPIGGAIRNHLRLLAATMFHRNWEVRSFP